MNQRKILFYAVVVIILCIAGYQNFLRSDDKIEDIRTIVDIQDRKLEKATVQRVVDGDTFVAKVNGKDRKIRLILIDTPESKAPNRPKGYLGEEAKDYAAKRLEGKTVWLERDVESNDRYGRWLRYVYLDVKDDKGEFYNGTLVRTGLARMATFPPNVKYVDDIRKWQTDAREANRGIWKNINDAFPDRKIEK
ncbi:thermonuclease family protein [uncultured Brevibacillus sp.]|uniref:thermonuclease family protein n=1 Tax=uncultured Brevibacillus sp. TaxID=169970 RepID=UPI0025944C72|nr:thermonuclease family protein [uncultured Brevibacillus sp.]